MASVDGDVYRALRNRYEALCEKHEAAADAYRAERLSLRDQRHAVDTSPPSGGMGMAAPLAGRKAEKETTK